MADDWNSDDRDSGGKPSERLIPVPLLQLKKTEALFVPSADFPSAKADIKNSAQRIYLIRSSKNYGQTMAALKLAMILKGYAEDGGESEFRVYLLARGGETMRSLNDILKLPELKPNSIVIVPEMLDFGFSFRELDSLKADLYRNVLASAEKNLYLILTTTVADDDLKEVNLRSSALRIENVDLQEVFNRHLQYCNYTPSDSQDNTAKLLEEFREQILQSLNTPKRLGVFFTRVQNDAPNTAEQFKEIIEQQSGRNAGSIRRWFRDLGFNNRLFALLVALLYDDFNPQLDNVEELYTVLLHKLRLKPGLDNERSFIDPRRMSQDELLSPSNLKVNPDGSIKFTETIVHDHVRKNEVPNFHGMLWVIAELLADYKFHHDDGARYDDWLSTPDRPALTISRGLEMLAYLTGQVGIYRPRKLEMLLEKLADIEEAALVAEILKPIANRPEHYDFLQRILKMWLPEEDNKPIHSTRFMASARTLTEIYPRVRRYAELHPTQLSNNGAEVGEMQAMRSASETLTVLDTAIDRMANSLGQLTQEAKVYRETQEAVFQNYLARLSAEQGRENPLSEGQIASANREIDRQVAQYVLHLVEAQLLEMFEMLRKLNNTYAVAVVSRIEQWLKQGLELSEQQDNDDRDIERILSLDDNPLIEWSEEQKEKNRLHKSARKDRVLRVAAAMAVYLFFISTNPPKPKAPETAEEKAEENEGTTNAAPVESSTALEEKSSEGENERENEIEILHEDGENENSEGNSPETIEDGVAAGSEESSDASDEQPDRQQDRKTIQTQPATSIDFFQSFLPLMHLLPHMLQASDRTWDVESFLEKVEGSPDLVRFYRNSRSKNPQKARESIHFDPQLNWVEDILNLSPLDVALHSIRGWYERFAKDSDVSKRWVEEVHPALLHLVNTASHGQRALLRTLLFKQGWMDSPYEDVRRVAHSLLARTYVLDGTVMDVPSERYGVILLDAWADARSGQRAWAGYYRQTFEIIQRLMMHTPLRVFHMGQITSLKLPNQRVDTGGALLQHKDLTSRRLLPRLIMPFLMPVDAESLIKPEPSHFVLVLTPLRQVTAEPGRNILEDIHDLTDVFDLATPRMTPEAQALLNDPFATTQEKEDAAKMVAPTEWVWRNKIVLLSPYRAAVLRDLNRIARSTRVNGMVVNQHAFAENVFTVLSIDEPSNKAAYLSSSDIEMIEVELNAQIATNLHYQPDDVWFSDVGSIWSQLGGEANFPIFSMSNLSEVANQLNQWVNDLDSVAKARHPLDVTLTISVSILAIARHNLPIAVNIIHNWLSKKGESDRETHLAHVMGTACTKLLFNYFDLSPRLLEDFQNIGEILRLLPPFMERNPNVADFRPVIRVVMRWARFSEWAERLVGDDRAELLEASRLLKKPQHIQELRQIVSVNELLLALSVLQSKSELPIESVKDLLVHISEWHESNPINIRREKLNDLTRQLHKAGFDKLTDDFVREAEELANTIDDELNSGQSSVSMYVLYRILENHFYPLSRYSLDELRATVLNVKRVANAVRLQLYSRPGDTMPDLPTGKRYGVVIVSSTPRSRSLVTMALGFVKRFQTRMRELDRNDILLTVHRLGRTELIYSSRPQALRRKQLYVEGAPDYAPIISPILELYKNLDQVAFIVILMDREPVDLQDWSGNPEFLDRFYPYTRRSNTDTWLQRFMGEVKHQRLQERLMGKDALALIDLLFERFV